MNTTPPGIDPDRARTRLQELTVVDVRTPGEYASGHLPGAHNIPLGALRRALPALRAVDGGLLLVCASGARAEQARADLAEHGVTAAVLTGGTRGWAEHGHELHRPERGRSRTPWAMERQVRLTAGAAVLAGLGLGRVHPAWLLLSAGVAGGLVFSALTDTCGMAALLARLPHNRPRATDLEATLAVLGSARG
ncbi:rhodanese-like domain-containing protein [Streptomyces sp. NPDC007162]|uniref:rhodanese-like domain-containing protein n=1 Tax=Streptomyces sp. NPDC007162 TaxID=3156917 RepID=UPI0033D06EED